MAPLAEPPTGGDVQAYVRKAPEDYTAMIGSQFEADWLPVGDFRPTKERSFTGVTRFHFDVNTAQRATPIESDLVRAGGDVLLSTPALEQHGPQHEAAVRLALLARKSAGSISPEDDARLRVATERLRKLLPRVTASDFETLADVAEKVATSRGEVDALRAELGLDD